MTASIRIDPRLMGWHNLFDGAGRCPEDDIGSFEDEGGASPGDSGRWRAVAPPPEAGARRIMPLVLPPADAAPVRVILTAGATAHSARAHHRDIPELRSDGGSPEAAVANLAEDLAREIDDVADHYRRELFGRALADVRAHAAHERSPGAHGPTAHGPDSP